MLSRDSDGFHQVPGGKIRYADIADLAAAHQRVHRLQGFFQRRQTVPFMQLIQIDMAAAQAPETCFAPGDDMMPRQRGIVRTLAHAKTHFARDKYRLAPALCLHRLTENFFRQAAGVDVGGVHKVHAGIDAEIKLAFRPGNIGGARLLERAAAAEGHGAEGECGNLQAGAAELAILHKWTSMATRPR
jgi:hypothetical protein